MEYQNTKDLISLLEVLCYSCLEIAPDADNLTYFLFLVRFTAAREFSTVVIRLSTYSFWCAFHLIVSSRSGSLKIRCCYDLCCYCFDKSHAQLYT